MKQVFLLLYLLAGVSLVAGNPLEMKVRNPSIPIRHLLIMSSVYEVAKRDMAASEEWAKYNLKDYEISINDKGGSYRVELAPSIIDPNSKGAPRGGPPALIYLVDKKSLKIEYSGLAP